MDHTRADRGCSEIDTLAARLYAEERTRLLAIARQNSDHEDDAEEALSEAFALFLAKFDPGKFPEPVSWLTTTLKRVCWGTARQAKRERSEFGQELERRVEGGVDPNDWAETRETAGEVREAMAELKPQERRVVGLLALGYSYREIMELTGWTYTKINRCSAEGRARLRELGLEIYKCR